MVFAEPDTAVATLGTHKLRSTVSGTLNLLPFSPHNTSLRSTEATLRGKGMLWWAEAACFLADKGPKRKGFGIMK